MRFAPFYGWIKDLSARDTTTIFNLFGLLPYSVPDMLMIGILPLIMGGTMYLQQKLSPNQMSSEQQKVFRFMPLIFIFLFSSAPAGLILYWIVSNLISILQQFYSNKKYG